MEVNDNTDSSNKSVPEGRSEFYLDLLEVFGEPNNNSIQKGTSSSVQPIASNPTIIRPKVIPRSSSSIKKPRPAPRVPSRHSAVGSCPVPKPAARKKKPPPRPAPPNSNKRTSVPPRLSKVPPSYSKVLEEDIRACIFAYSSESKDRSYTIRSEPAKRTVDRVTKPTRSNSTGASFDLIQLDTPEKLKPEPREMNINGVPVTTKNLKQAGAVASFLNKNPKLSKHVVPAKYQTAVKATGKVYDFREDHKNDFKHVTAAKSEKTQGKQVDLLGDLEPEMRTSKMESAKSTSFTYSTFEKSQFSVSKPNNAPSVNPKYKRPSKPPPAVPKKPAKPAVPKKPAKPAKPTAPVKVENVVADLNAWGDDGSSQEVEPSQPDPVNLTASNENIGVVADVPQSPTAPEPEHPPPVLLDTNESLPSFEPQGIALLNYTACKPNEISCQTKDIIMLLKDEGDRFYGRCGSKEGYVPKFCIDVLFPLPVDNEELKYMATCNYQAKFPGEISFETGDIIILNQRIEDTDRMIGTLEKNGMSGEFSSAYVKLMEFDIDTQEMVDSLYSTALYDYDGDPNSGDISFKAGDKITVTSKISDDWLYGKDNSGQEGQFPATFIDSVPPNIPQYVPKANTPIVLQEVLTLYDFQGSASDELSFKKDDKIAVTDEIDDSWMRGYTIDNPGFIGIFPRSYVDYKDKNENFVRVRALYQFDATSPDELSFKVNDIIDIIETINDDWMIGRISNNKGMFPASFVTTDL